MKIYVDRICKGLFSRCLPRCVFLSETGLVGQGMPAFGNVLEGDSLLLVPGKLCKEVVWQDAIVWYGWDIFLYLYRKIRAPSGSTKGE